MRAVLATSQGKVALGDLPIPAIGPYEALVQVEACAICNSTDHKFIFGEFRPGPYPMAIGHESVGHVVALGDKVRHFRLGDRVLRVILYDRHVPGGSSRIGGMSEYGVVIDGRAVEEDGAPIEVHRHAAKQQLVPADIPSVAAAMLIPLKEALVLIKLHDVQPGQPLAIVGSGPVAQTFCYFAKIVGASPIVAFGRRPAFAERFQKLGADAYVVGDDYPEVVKAQLAAGGFPRVIEAVGSREAMKRCLSLASPTGRICGYGVTPESHGWDDADLKDPRVWSILGPPEEDVHDEMLQLVASGRVKLDDWVTHVMPVEECTRAFEMVFSKQAQKVVLTF